MEYHKINGKMFHDYLFYSCIYWLTRIAYSHQVFLLCTSEIRAKIPSSIISSSSAEESKSSSRPILKSSKLPTENQENIDGKRFQRIPRTKQSQPVGLSRGSSSDSHGVVPNSRLMSRPRQDENDSDSSFEDSKIIEDLFFVK